MFFTFDYNVNRILLSLTPPSRGFLPRFLSGRASRDLDGLAREERSIALALADLKAIADEEDFRDDLEIGSDHLVLSHRLAARVDAATAAIIGLPQLVDLVFRTDVEGTPGSTSFRVRYSWMRDGQRQLPRRIGSILETTEGTRRLTHWLMEAIEIADSFTPAADNDLDWEVLARFRRSLGPATGDDPSELARVGMSGFLKGLEVRLADSFGIAPKGVDDALDFDPVPFSGRTLARSTEPGMAPDESNGELDEAALNQFQSRVRHKGPLPAYKVGDGSFLVVDRSAAPVLELMTRMQRAEPKQRDAFVRNPRPFIAQVIEERLRASGKLDNLSPAGEEEAIETAAGPIFVETQQYSERVTGIVVYRKPSIPPIEGSGTTWLPESFPPVIAKRITQMDPESLDALCERVEQAIASGAEAITVDDETLPANDETLRGLQDLRAAAAPDGESESAGSEEPETEMEAEDECGHETKQGPYIIETLDNFDDLRWRPQRGRRRVCIETSVPRGIRTPLKTHQIESLDWQIAAWKAGLPGILNADEQGLGKTLQTIAFLRWLKEHMAQETAEHRGPVLVVAPTSLLENWEAEVGRHLDDHGLGHLIRLYGSGLGGFKSHGVAGIDTQTGEEKLDFSLIHEAINENRAHRFWLLTTYTTLTNYQHSLGRIPLSAIVFDEIQAIKNPASLRAMAARAMNADFSIGLTGTPIENSAVDLWAIMDGLCPGVLGTLKDYRERFGVADYARMEELHARVFTPQGDLPALAFRRLKDQVARDLPEKSRRLHPRAMPTDQARIYEKARDKLKQGQKGAALKMLHHIRSVSVHPAVEEHFSDAAFKNASARLSAVFDILHRIKNHGERALIFIEHRRMQHRFIALAQTEFNLGQIDLINGDTPIQTRQTIVDRFQQHLHTDRGFDMLVLGPRAAGTGLTLTAATHVIHLSRWWNPAVEEQCNDRVHRIGQRHPVTVHIPMAVHPGYREQSFDCLLQSLMTRKRRLASAALWPMGDTQEDAAHLQQLLAEDRSGDVADPVLAAMDAMFRRDGLQLPPRAEDGSLPC